MRFLLISFALVALVSGIVVNQKNKFGAQEDNILSNQEEVLSESKTESLVESSEKTSEQNGVEQDVSYTSTPVPITDVSTTTPIKSFLDVYIYPNSNVVEKSSNRLIMESSDSAEEITNWYKEKISSEGMNVKTFVATKANEKILNKLVGTSGSREVRIEISREQSDKLVRIVVDVSL